MLIRGLVLLGFLSLLGSAHAQFIGRTVGTSNTQSFQTDNFQDLLVQQHLSDLGVDLENAARNPSDRLWSLRNLQRSEAHTHHRDSQPVGAAPAHSTCSGRPCSCCRSPCLLLPHVCSFDSQLHQLLQGFLSRQRLPKALIMRIHESSALPKKGSRSCLNRICVKRT